MKDFIFHIVEGKVTNRKGLAEMFTLKDGTYLLTIKSKKKRSLPQNAYLHGVVIPMVFDGLLDAGFDDVKTKEDAKEIIKSLFLKKQMVSKSTGEVIEIVGHTAELTTVEFNEFFESVIKWAAEYLNIQIPYPNEQLIMFAEYDDNVGATIIQ